MEKILHFIKRSWLMGKTAVIEYRFSPNVWLLFSLKFRRKALESIPCIFLVIDVVTGRNKCSV